MNPDPATPWPVFGTVAPTWPPSLVHTTVSPVCSLPDGYVVVPTLATTVFGGPPPGSPPHPASTPHNPRRIKTLRFISLCDAHSNAPAQSKDKHQRQPNIRSRSLPGTFPNEMS